MTLDHIENKIIRPTYRDPRIHFAVNCAALSCPQLDNRAFTTPDLDDRLEQALRALPKTPTTCAARKTAASVQNYRLVRRRLLGLVSARSPQSRGHAHHRQLPAPVPPAGPSRRANRGCNHRIQRLRLGAQRGQRNGKPPPSGRLPVIDPTPFWCLIRRTDCAPFPRRRWSLVHGRERARRLRLERVASRPPLGAASGS